MIFICNSMSGEDRGKQTEEPPFTPSAAHTTAARISFLYINSSSWTANCVDEFMQEVPDFSRCLLSFF